MRNVIKNQYDNNVVKISVISIIINDKSDNNKIIMIL